MVAPRRWIAFQGRQRRGKPIIDSGATIHIANADTMQEDADIEGIKKTNTEIIVADGSVMTAECEGWNGKLGEGLQFYYFHDIDTDMISCAKLCDEHSGVTFTNKGVYLLPEASRRAVEFFVKKIGILIGRKNPGTGVYEADLAACNAHLNTRYRLEGWQSEGALAAKGNVLREKVPDVPVPLPTRNFTMENKNLRRKGQTIGPSNEGLLWVNRTFQLGSTLAKMKELKIIKGLESVSNADLVRVQVTESQRLSMLKAKKTDKVRKPNRDIFYDCCLDIMGPFSEGIGSKAGEKCKYILVMVTRNQFGTTGIYTKCLPTKSPKRIAVEVRKLVIKSRSENKSSSCKAMEVFPRVDTIKTDGAFGEEFTNSMLNLNIVHYKSTVDGHAENGVAERMIQRIGYSTACALWLARSLPLELWPKAVEHVTWVLNRIACKPMGISPFQNRTGKPPSIEKLRTWGATAYCVLDRGEYWKKSLRSQRIEVGINMGLCEETNGTAYTIYFPKRNIFSIRRNCWFNEDANNWHPYRYERIKAGPDKGLIHEDSSLGDDKNYDHLSYQDKARASWSRGQFADPGLRKKLGSKEQEALDTWLAQIEAEMNEEDPELLEKEALRILEQDSEDDGHLDDGTATTEIDLQDQKISNENLPDGWTVKTFTRKTGVQRGKVYYQFYDEAGNKYRSIKAVRKELKRRSEVIENSKDKESEEESSSESEGESSESSEEEELSPENWEKQSGAPKIRIQVLWRTSSGKKKWYGARFTPYKQDDEESKGVAEYDVGGAPDHVIINWKSKKNAKIWMKDTERWEPCTIKKDRRKKTRDGHFAKTARESTDVNVKAKMRFWGQTDKEINIYFERAKTRKTFNQLVKRMRKVQLRKDKGIPQSEWACKGKAIKKITEENQGEFLAKDIPIPQTLKEALSGPYAHMWIKAIERERLNYEQHKTYVQCRLPPGEKILAYKWVFDLKKLPNGKLRAKDAFKGRLVVAGHREIEGVDYFKEPCSSPVVRSSTFNLLMTFAVNRGFVLRQADYSAAFLRSKIPEDGPQKYLKPLYGQQMQKGMNCVKLLRGVYGLHAASSMWADKLGGDLEELGFTKSKIDGALFIRRAPPKTGEEKGEIECLIATWVDDCIICVKDQETFEKLIVDMEKQYQNESVKTFSSEPGPLVHALGMHVLRAEDGSWIELSHEDAINNLIDEYGVRNMPGKSTPMASTKKPLSKADCPQKYSEEERLMKNKPYRRLIGQLLHISGWSRWDIRYTVCFLARFANNPGKRHWDAAIRVLQYLKQTIHLHMRFGKPKSKDYLPLVKVLGAVSTTQAGPYLGGEYEEEKSMCQIFSDTSHADCLDTARSTGGFCVFVEGCPISMESKRQGLVSRSTAIAELYGLDKASREAKYMKALLEELDYKVKFVDVVGDNSTSIGLATTAKHSNATKHVRVATMGIHEAIKEGTIRLFWGASAYNVADIFTKSLPRETHQRLTRVLLGLGNEDSKE